MPHSDRIDTLVRGADGVLYEVSDAASKPVPAITDDAFAGDATPSERVVAGHSDHAAARIVIDPGDHEASRIMIEASDHAAARIVIDPGDFEAARIRIDPGDHAASRIQIDPGA